MNEEKGKRERKRERGNHFFFRFKNTSHMTNFLFSLSCADPHFLWPSFLFKFFASLNRNHPQFSQAPSLQLLIWVHEEEMTQDFAECEHQQ